MAKIYKEIASRIPREYEQIAFQISNECRQLGLNKYEFNQIRDQLYQEVEDAFNQRIPSSDNLKKKLHHYMEKLSKKAIRKSPLELLFSYLFVIFIILSTCFPIVYLLSFTKSNISGIYSSGLSLYINFYNIFLSVTYCFLGVLVAAFIQNITSSQRKKLILSTLLIGVFLAALFFVLSLNFPDLYLNLNFIICEFVFVAITFGGFLLENKIAKEKFDKRNKQREKNKGKN